MATEVKKPEEKTTRSVNRLQSVYPLRALLDENYKTGREAAEAGKPVAWAMRVWNAPPILRTMGIEPIYVENFGTACAAAGIAPAYLDRAAAEGFPTYMCGYLVNCLGYTARMKDLGWQIPPEAPRGGMPKPDLLLAREGCEAAYKPFQALARYLDVPLWCGSLSRGGRTTAKEALMEGVYEREIAFTVKGLYEFIAFLERFTGKKFDYDKYEEDITNEMETEALWHSITNELRKAKPCPMHSRDHWSAQSSIHLGIAEPTKARKLYQAMYDEVKYRVDNGISGINRPEKYRFMLYGLPPWHALNFFDQLAERGWNMVRQPQTPQYPMDLSWVKDPVERYVRFKNRSVASDIDDEFPDPKEAAEVRAEIMQKGYSNKLHAVDVKTYQCDGAFHHSNLTCHVGAASQMLLPHQIMNAYKVPSLVVAGDLVDTRIFDPEDALKKCEAFEETMEHYREVRKKEGLDW